MQGGALRQRHPAAGDGDQRGLGAAKRGDDLHRLHPLAVREVRECVAERGDDGELRVARRVLGPVGRVSWTDEAVGASSPGGAR
jgi:hypothetical protein